MMNSFWFIIDLIIKWVLRLGFLSFVSYISIYSLLLLLFFIIEKIIDT